MGTSFQDNDNRISLLLYRMNKGQATLEEKHEYVDLLYKNKYINSEEFNKYKNDLNQASPTFLEVLISIGAAVFLGNVISELFSNKK